MAEYIPIYTDITELGSDLAQKMFVRYELLEDLAKSMGIPPELLENGDEIARNITKYVDSDGIAQNVALEVDGDEGSENAGKTQAKKVRCNKL